MIGLATCGGGTGPVDQAYLLFHLANCHPSKFLNEAHIANPAQLTRGNFASNVPSRTGSS